MTPLYDALRAYTDSDPARFHMPGHKGKPIPIPGLDTAARLDVTELSSTGNLYCAGEPFDRAQQLWAERFGFESCQFLTGGSTMGIYTGLALCCAPGDQILVDRGCHQAVFHAMALLELEPVYLERPWLREENLAGPISLPAVEEALSLHPNIKTICITSPTYAGVLSDVGGISTLARRQGKKLFVDGAHGAHLPFLGLTPFQGADAAVVSAHKTLPALGQSALLFTNGIDPLRVRRAASVFGTSSPSYLILASIDASRAWLEENGGAEGYQLTALRVAELRRRFPSLGSSQREGLALDPTRFTLSARDGRALAEQLEREGIVPEMSDSGHVVLICTPQDLDSSLSRLESALEQHRDQLGPGPAIPPPPLPRRVCSVRQAVFGETEVLPLEQCEGRAAANQLAPYPPGVPVVAPGELITKKELSYLNKIGYNNQEVSVVLRR